MVRRKYIPSKGDIIILTFDPQSGHEQKGRRPAIVISNNLFQQHTGLAMVCPITNTDKEIPFHIKIDEPNVSGCIMTEQVKSIDFASRGAQFLTKSNPKVLSDVLSIVESIVL